MCEIYEPEYYIFVYDSENDKTVYFNNIDYNADETLDAIFTNACFLTNGFSSLVEAQSVCKVLANKYIRSLKYEDKVFDNSIRSTLGVATLPCNPYLRGNKMIVPYKIWSLADVNSNGVIHV